MYHTRTHLSQFLLIVSGLVSASDMIFDSILQNEQNHYSQWCGVNSYKTTRNRVKHDQNIRDNVQMKIFRTNYTRINTTRLEWNSTYREIISPPKFGSSRFNRRFISMQWKSREHEIYLVNVNKKMKTSQGRQSEPEDTSF